MDSNVSYIKTACVKVHSHTFITHVLKVFLIYFFGSAIWSYLHFVRVCMSVPIILSVKGSPCR